MHSMKHNTNHATSSGSTDTSAQGFVSIVAATLLVVVLSLLTIGFTQLMQREQRQAIDDLLSRQALYAAESGINDVAAAIAAKSIYYVAESKTDCDPDFDPDFDSPGTGIQPEISWDKWNSDNLNGQVGVEGVTPYNQDVALTCILYDKTPGALDYQFEVRDSKVVQLETAGLDAFRELTITWGNPDGNDVSALSSCAAPSLDHPSSRVGTPSLVRLDLTSLPTAPYSRDDLLERTEYLYLEPCRDVSPPLPTASPYPFDPSTAANQIRVECTGNGDRSCEATIDFTDFNLLGNASRTMLARIGSVYGPANLAVSGTDTAGSDIQFEGAQIGIDVTARAGDVVRRLRASVPVDRTADVPEAALQVFGGVCKRLNLLDETAGSVDVVDECSGPSLPVDVTVTVCDNSLTPPALVTELESVVLADTTGRYTLGCPPPPGCGLNGVFNLGAYATTSLPLDTDRRFALDVATWLPPVGRLNSPISSPHIPLASLGLEIDPSCTYEVTYEAYCSYVDPLASPPEPRPPLGCGVGQPLEEARLEFYDASVGTDTVSPSTLRCSGSLIGYSDTNDLSNAPGTPQNPSWTETVPLIPAGSGQIRCMRLVHVCTAIPATAGCTPPIESSIHIESIQWRVL